MTTKPMIPFLDTVVSEIDLDSEWFNAIAADRVPLPGANRYERDDNLVTRAQVLNTVRGMQRLDALKDLKFSQACEIGRSRRFANLRGKQLDFNLVNYFSQVANEENYDEPLTPGQVNMVDTTVRALLGVVPHRIPEVQTAIDKLTPEQRDSFVDAFEACETRGELNAVMRRYERRVPTPYEVAREARSRSAAALENVDITTESEDNF